MERKKLTENFYLDEFINPRTYFSESDNGLSKIDLRIIIVAQALRSLQGYSMTINNWWSFYQENKYKMSINDIINAIEDNKKIRKNSGFRHIDCKIGAKYSTHKTGIAIDPKDSGVLYNILVNNAQLFYDLGVRRVEDEKLTPGWLHVDLKTKNEQKGIRIIDLRKQTGLIKL